MGRPVPTVLVFRRELVAVLFLTVIVFSGTLLTIVLTYPSVESGYRRIVEVVAGGVIVTISVLVGAIVRWIHRNSLLERELRRGRALSMQPRSPADTPTILTTLGSAIHAYNDDLNVSRRTKAGRIEAQRGLLQAVLRETTDEIIVLSGSGGVLYASGGVAKRLGDDRDLTALGFEPPTAALVSHLVNGKGPGTVVVDDREMVFFGVFGRTVVGGEKGGLAYIVITTDRGVVRDNVTVAGAIKKGSDAFRSFWSRRGG